MSACVVSVIIVNFNSGQHLPRCLRSLQSQTLRAVEIIVVDNNSSDGSVDLLSQYPDVHLISNNTNSGFAAGQNQGFSVARGRYLLALNYDLVMMPTFLEELVSALEADPAAGWACGKLLTMQPDGQLTDAFYAAGHLLPPNRFPGLRGLGERDLGQYERQEYVFGAPGAAAIYKREMVSDIAFNGQFFDESFFTWMEDVDVDWRAQNRGWRCLYVPTAVAYHQGHIGELYSEPFRSFRAALTIRNRWLMILANERTPHIRALLTYELSLLKHVLRDGLLQAYANAFVSAIRLSRTQFRKRRQISERPRLPLMNVSGPLMRSTSIG